MNLAALDGLRIPGGCDHCDAYQTFHAHAHGPNAHKITTHHDDWCPWLNGGNRAARRAARRHR